MEIKIMVAAHKAFQMPQDEMYLPIHVGNILHQDLKLGYQSDAEGDNISSKNPYFCELTAIYWGWKNLDAEFLGLSHYRRYFSVKKNNNDKLGSVLTKEQAERLCSQYDIILPKRRRYYLSTLWQHYSDTHDVTHLEKTKEIIHQYYPEYVDSFDLVMGRTWCHMFNMFLMRKELVDQYCTWVFPILFELEGRIDLTNMSSFDARLFGRISEFLLDVWIEKNGFAYKEIGFVQLGKENWPKKIISFLCSKFFKMKYTQSM